MLDGEDPEGGWVDTHHFAQPGDLGEVQEAAKDMVLDDEKEADAGDEESDDALSDRVPYLVCETLHRT